jgi:hypothetical protein
MRDSWRSLAGATLLALVLTIGFSRESYGLWPLFTLLDFPGQLGRAGAFLLMQGQATPIVLGPAHDVRLAAAPPTEILAGGLGLGLTLAAGALCLFLLPREKLRRAVLFAISGLLILAALVPPHELLRTPAPLVAGATLGALALPALAPQAPGALRFLASSFLLAPLWEMREPLFVSGAPGIDLALLERGSGMPVAIWVILGLAVAVALCVRMAGRPNANTTATANSTTSTSTSTSSNTTTTPNTNTSTNSKSTTSS